MKQQPLGDRSLGTLVLFDLGQPDLRPSQEVVRGELVSLKHGDTQDVLLQVLDEELTVGVPLGIQCVLHQENKEEGGQDQRAVTALVAGGGTSARI